MAIKLTPAVPSTNPKNTLRVKVEFMHGDADGYSNETFSIQNVPQNEELISRIIEGISIGLAWMDEDDWHRAPFLMNDDDWNSTNMDEETGIPLVGTNIHFINEVQRTYSVDRQMKSGTVIDGTEEVLIIIGNDGTKYEIPNNEDLYAPSAAIPIIVDGYCGSFSIEGIDVRFEGQGDHTADNQFAASGSIDEVTYFDANGTMFNVSGYY
jgi:hypothetical protein